MKQNYVTPQNLEALSKDIREYVRQEYAPKKHEHSEYMTLEKTVELIDKNIAESTKTDTSMKIALFLVGIIVTILSAGFIFWGLWIWSPTIALVCVGIVLFIIGISIFVKLADL